MSLIEQLLQMMRPQVQSQHNYGGQQEEPEVMTQPYTPPAKPGVDPRLLSGMYNQMLKPGFEMPVPYSHDVPVQTASQWSPSVQASLIQLLMRQSRKGKGK